MTTKHTPGKLVAKHDLYGGYDCMYSAIDLYIEGALPPFEGSDKPQDQTVAVLDRRDYDHVPSWEQRAKDPVMVANGDRMVLCWNMHDELTDALAALEEVARDISRNLTDQDEQSAGRYYDLLASIERAGKTVSRARGEEASHADS